MLFFLFGAIRIRCGINYNFFREKYEIVLGFYLLFFFCTGSTYFLTQLISFGCFILLVIAPNVNYNC